MENDRSSRDHSAIKQPSIDVCSLVATDVRVHLKVTDDAIATDAAAKKCFGESGALRDPVSNQVVVYSLPLTLKRSWASPLGNRLALLHD